MFRVIQISDTHISPAKAHFAGHTPTRGRAMLAEPIECRQNLNRSFGGETPI
jgi:hypothetical protein